MDVEVWSSCSSGIDDTARLSDIENDSPPSSSDIDNSIGDQQSTALVSWLVGFFLLLQARFHLQNSVLKIIFTFLKAFLVLLGHVYSSCSNLGKLFPSTFYRAQKSCGISSDSFKRFCVCKRCHIAWKLEDCFEGSGNRKKAKTCPHVPFTAGSQKRCGGLLLKTVELATGKKCFYPLHTYCYVDLHTSLQTLLLQPEFTENSNWQSHSSSGDVLKDVYDGRVWKRFLNWSGKPFLEEPYSFAALINVDWFQPYKHLTYSVGVIYLLWFNLPRVLQYKLKNISLIGIIPGPT